MRPVTSSFFFVIVALLAIASACKKTETGIHSSLPQKESKDLSYGRDSQQKMDVYLHAGRTVADTKVIILVHGGAWVGGDKKNWDLYIKELRPLLGNYAIINLNYRLATIKGENKWPTQIDDIRLAIEYIENHGNDFMINAADIGLIGSSAGAQLALLAAYSGNSNRHIKAVADMFGPTDMVDFYNRSPQPFFPPFFKIFLDGTPATNPANYQSASPLFFVNKQSPPTIIFHGTADNTVYIHQSDSLASRLLNAGVKYQYVVYAGEGHGWSGANLSDTYHKMVAFIKENVQ